MIHARNRFTWTIPVAPGMRFPSLISSCLLETIARRRVGIKKESRKPGVLGLGMVVLLVHRHCGRAHSATGSWPVFIDRRESAKATLLFDWR